MEILLALVIDIDIGIDFPSPITIRLAPRGADLGSSAATKASLSEGFMKSFMTLKIINFADMVRREGWSFMGYEENFITIKLI